MPEQEYATQARAVESLVERYVGLGDLHPNAPRVTRRGALAAELAFTGESVDSLDEIWEAHYDAMNLRLPSAVEGYSDSYRREFTVRTSGEHILEVHASAQESDADLLPRLSAQDTAEQLRENDERYAGLPEEAPQLTFLQAVDRVLAEGIGSPFQAKEIDGYYVQHARGGEEPHPVWIIELRGLPPYSVKGPPGFDSEAVPRWQRNHMRNVVDARTGRVLFANNLPQPRAGRASAR